jgi:2-keto-3-deoxy-L-rhamnonate aldolase RhmA
VPAAEYFAGTNSTLTLLALIEDLEGVENADEIAAVGLDVLWVGTGDLALAYGVPGETDHPLVLQAARQVLDACQRHKVAAGFPARKIADIAWAREQGYRVIGFGGAEQYIMQMGREFLQAAGR